MADNKLSFTLRLIDKFSRPLRKIQAQVQRFTHHVSLGARRIRNAFIGGLSSVLAFNTALRPAVEMNRALGEVKSLGVLEADLVRLRQESMKFTARFGGDASNVVRSAYDIQSAIAGLTGKELTTFTVASGVMAKATKADVQTVTAYLGTMYGIFQEQADAMGKAKWVNQVAGQFAQSVQRFKTTGQGMAEAFSNLGGEAASAKISMQEQFAILGQLQATMSGSEAATKYRSFLVNVGKAQKELGMKFTDARGQLLSMPDILAKIEKRYGAIDTVAKADVLKKAFGSDEAVALIKLLAKDIGGLRKNIDLVGKSSGMKKALEMADSMTDPWMRFTAVVTNLRIKLGGLVLPVVNKVVDKLSAAADLVGIWADRFPYLAKAIGLSTLAMMALVLVVSAFAAVTGIAHFMIAAVRGVMILWRITMIGLQATLLLLKVIGVLGLVGSLLLAAAVIVIVKGAMLLWQGVIWLVNAALLANPITWVVVAIIALVAVVILAIRYWDQLKAAIVGVAQWFTRMPAWVKIFATVFLPFLAIPLLIIANWERVKAWFSALWEWLSKGFQSAVSGILKAISPITSLLDKLGTVLGLTVDINKTSETKDTGSKPSLANAYKERAKSAVVPGASSLIKKYNQTASTDNSKKMGDLHVHTDKEVNISTLRSLLAMQGLG